MRRIICPLLICIFIFSVCSCGSSQRSGSGTEANSGDDSEIVNSVIEAISSIGEINGDSINAINSAFALYNALTDEQKTLVTNYAELVRAQDDYNKLMAKPVVEAISSFSSFDFNNEEVLLSALEQVAAARKEYENLSDVYKDYIDNYGELLLAEEKISNYKVNSLISFIDENLSSITLLSEDALSEAKDKYAELTSDEQARITNYNIVVQGELTIEELKNSPPIKVLSISNYELDSYWDELWLNITFENSSTSVIKNYSFNVFPYDEDGVPLEIYGRYNCSKTGSTPIKVNSSINDTCYTDFKSTANYYIVLFEKVEFFDGSVWTNPQYEELYAKYDGQLLDLNDDRIIAA